MRKLTDTIRHGSCQDVLRNYPDQYFSSVVTDPPYGLSFMGKKWDYDVPSVELWEEISRVLKPGGHMLVACGTRTQHAMVRNIELAGFEIRDIVVWIYGSGFPKSSNISKSIDKLQGAVREQVRIPGNKARNPKSIQGGHGVEGGDRPWMRKAVEKGYHTVDSDKPVSPDAEHWEGWGTALKPAAELWTLCRKPLSEQGTARNVLRHGTGGINIDASRINPTGERLGGGEEAKSTFKDKEGWDRPWMHDEELVKEHAQNVSDNVERASELGRWPANVVLGHHTDCKKLGTKKISSSGNWTGKQIDSAAWFNTMTGDRDDPGIKQEGKETVDNWNCHPDCPVAIMDMQSGERPSCGNYPHPSITDDGLFGRRQQGPLYDDTGGASRFFYQAKAHNAERWFWCNKCKEFSNDRDAHEEHRTELMMHPTQKPEELMRYLVRMITPPEGVVLDPFLGSGTTCVGAKLENIDCVGIERELIYHAIARVRYRYTGQNPLQERPFSGLEI